MVEPALVEATTDGLALAAAHQGLTLAVALRANGLAGGGPERPLGARRKLLGELAHTLGADDIFVRLVATARERAAGGATTRCWRGAAPPAAGVRSDRTATASTGAPGRSTASSSSRTAGR